MFKIFLTAQFVSGLKKIFCVLAWEASYFYQKWKNTQLESVVIITGDLELHNV